MRSRKNIALSKVLIAVAVAVIIVIAAVALILLTPKTPPAPPAAKKPAAKPEEEKPAVTPPKKPPAKPTVAKRILVIAYKNATKLPKDKLVPYSTISPSFYSNLTLDALIWAGRYTTNPEWREVIYKVIQKVTNYELPLIWVAQLKRPRVYWEWVKGIYFHPTLVFRINHLEKDPTAPEPGIFRVGATEEPHSLDPAVSYWGFDWWIMHQIYDKLVTYEKEETKYVVPCLAAAWAHTENATVWFFVIRGGVVFYDPWENKTYPLEPEDVVYSLRRVVIMHQDPCWLIETFIDVNKCAVVPLEKFEKIIAKGLVTEFKDKVATVKSLDELLKFFGYEGKIAGVVKLVLKSPYPAILNILATSPASIVCKDVVEAHGGIKPGEINPWVYEHPVGTGPYYLVKWVHKQYLELRANPYYWGKDKPKIKKVIIKLIPEDETRIMLLKKGDLDYAAVPPSLLFKVKGVTLKYGGKTWKLVIKEQETLVIDYIVPNCEREPINILEVRQALAFATPYDQIIKVAHGGLAFKAYGVIPKGMFGFQCDDVIDYKYDIEKAKELLKKAGIDPTKYTITILICEGYKEFQDMATILQAAWSQLGFKVKIQVLSRPVFNQKIMTGDFDINLLGWGPDYIDPDDYAGPLSYGGYRFTEVKVYEVKSLEEAAKYIKLETAKKLTYHDWLVIVGEARG
ncbi:MAG: hypothetical protein DRJ40_07185 [Thermoprotei archaeon]|nr:MAG: hypothetical protein DRJ40_07185 [Thermoprotei archaeon]